MKRKSASAQPSRKTLEKCLLPLVRKAVLASKKTGKLEFMSRDNAKAKARELGADVPELGRPASLIGALHAILKSRTKQVVNSRHWNSPTAFFGLTLVMIVFSAVMIRTVDAATYQGPTLAPPGGNVPVTIWNRTSSVATQTNAAIDIDGNGGAFKGVSIGSAALAVAAGQNLIYGNVDTASVGNLLLLQNEGVEKLRVSVRGDLKAAGCFGGTFTGVTPAAQHGALLSAASYYGADNRCFLAFSGSHVCRAEEILESISCSVATDPVRTIANGTMAWVNAGPPGHTSFGNDCDGWQNNTSTYLGRFWTFNQTTGGSGSMTTCNTPGTGGSGLSFACCR